MKKKDKNVKTISKKYYWFCMSVFIFLPINLFALLGLYAAAFESGINYLFLGLAIGLSILEVAVIIFLVKNYKSITMYEGNKILNKMSIFHKIDINYDYLAFKEGLLKKGQKVTDYCYFYSKHRLKHKFYLFNESELNNEILTNIISLIKLVKYNGFNVYGYNVVYIEVDSFQDEYEDLISNTLKEQFKTSDYFNSIFQIYIYDQKSKDLHSFNMKFKENVIFDLKDTVKEEVSSKKPRKKSLYVIKSKKLSLALKIIGAILIIGSFLINIIPINSTVDHNTIVYVSMISFFIGTLILFINSYKNVDILNIIMFLILSTFTILSRLMIVHHEFIAFMVCALILLPLFLVSYYKYKNIHKVVIGLIFYSLISELYNLVDISFINSNDLRLFIPPLIIGAVFTGVFTFLILYKKTSKYFFNGKNVTKKSVKNTAIVFSILGCFMFSFCSSYVLITSINVGFTDLNMIENIEVVITRKHSSGGRTTTYYFNFEYEGNKCDVSVPFQHYKHYEEGDSIIISLYPGALGIDYFYYHIELNNFYES